MEKGTERRGRCAHPPTRVNCAHGLRSVHPRVARAGRLRTRGTARAHARRRRGARTYSTRVTPPPPHVTAAGCDTPARGGPRTPPRCQPRHAAPAAPVGGHWDKLGRTGNTGMDCRHGQRGGGVVSLRGLSGAEGAVGAAPLPQPAWHPSWQPASGPGRGCRAGRCRAGPGGPGSRTGRMGARGGGGGKGGTPHSRAGCWGAARGPPRAPAEGSGDSPGPLPALAGSPGTLQRGAGGGRAQPAHRGAVPGGAQTPEFPPQHPKGAATGFPRTTWGAGG